MLPHQTLRVDRPCLAIELQWGRQLSRHCRGAWLTSAWLTRAARS